MAAMQGTHNVRHIILPMPLPSCLEVLVNLMGSMGSELGSPLCSIRVCYPLLGLNRVPNFVEYQVPIIWGHFCRVPSTDNKYLTKCKYFSLY